MILVPSCVESKYSKNSY